MKTKLHINKFIGLSIYKFSKKWSFNLDVQERVYSAPVVKQHQFLVRGTLQSDLGQNWMGGIGFCTFFQAPNEPEAPVYLVVPELRPHVEFVFKQKMTHISFEHRYKAEARYFHRTDSKRTALEAGYEFGNFRLRYRLQANIPVLKVTQKCTATLKISDEIHINAGKKIINNSFDQNRFSVAVGFNLAHSWNLEAGWLNWFQMRPNSSYYDRSIFRLATSHTLNFVKPLEK